jgi:predicted small lipoprotein YifL
MKKTILTLLLTLAALTAYGQKMPSDYFEEADGYFAQKKYDEALTGYQYIVDNHPRSKYYPKALLNARLHTILSGGLRICDSDIQEGAAMQEQRIGG